MTHHHESSADVIKRLSRISGHVEAVKKMVAEDRDCSEVLIQIAAVRAALNSVGREILKDHIEHCVADAVESGDQQALGQLRSELDTYLK